MSRLRVVLMGTPDFAVPCLRALNESHEVLAVVTQPDRPRGRGRRLTPPPVKVVAMQLGLTVVQPEKLRRRAVRKQLMAYGADVFVVAAFGQILSPRLLAVPRLGCINVHASLLPRYRGAAPIQWAVINAEAQSGVTIMQMDAGVDTGPLLLQEAIGLRADETAGTLHDRLSLLGARLLIEALDGLASGRLAPRPQDERLAVLAPMLSKEDGHIDFNGAAKHVDCRIRGLDPWPGAYCIHDGRPLRLFHANSEKGLDRRGRPGEVLAVDDRGMLVACGSGAVWVSELQSPGSRRMAARAFAAGHELAPGDMLS